MRGRECVATGIGAGAIAGILVSSFVYLYDPSRIYIFMMEWLTVGYVSFDSLQLLLYLLTGTILGMIGGCIGGFILGLIGWLIGQVIRKVICQRNCTRIAVLASAVIGGLIGGGICAAAWYLVILVLYIGLHALLLG